MRSLPDQLPKQKPRQHRSPRPRTTASLSPWTASVEPRHRSTGNHWPTGCPGSITRDENPARAASPVVFLALCPPGRTVQTRSLKRCRNRSKVKRSKLVEPVTPDRFSQRSQEVLVENEVMVGDQDGPQHLARQEQMAKVTTTEPLTHPAIAAGIQGALVRTILPILQPHLALAGKRRRAASIACRHHAVKQVDPADHRLEQVPGSAHAHQVPGPIRRQHRRGRRPA